MNWLAEKLTERQSDPKSYSQPRELLSKHQARRIKRAVVSKYCRGELSQDAVDRAFIVFPELRGA
jgi:hypothetical protein